MSNLLTLSLTAIRPILILFIHLLSGLYVVHLSGAFTSSFPQGVLEVGDEILEINRRQAKDLRMEEIQSLLGESSCVLLRVLPVAHGL